MLYDKVNQVFAYRSADIGGGVMPYRGVSID